MSTETFERAITVAKGVLAGVTPGQLDDPTPCASWKVRELVNHLVGGSYFFASATEAGEVVPSEPPDFAAGDFVAAYDEGTTQAVAAFGAPGAQERIISLPFGQFPGAGFMGIATIDTFTHSWDLAKATGQSTDLDPALATELLAASQAMISEGFRGPEPMPFGAEQEPGAGATAADRLAAFLGRTP